MYRKFTGDNNRRPRQSMKLQQVYSLTRKAIDDYHMIQSGDRIAVGISGGKDSLTLLYALQGLRRFYPHPFELCAVTVDLGFDNLKLDKIGELCDTLGVPYHIVNTDIAKIIFEDRRETNPCSLCAKMRHGARGRDDDDVSDLRRQISYFSSGHLSGPHRYYSYTASDLYERSRCDRIRQQI